MGKRDMARMETKTIDGVTVYVEGSGPVVLMMHGWPDTHRLWDAVVPALSDAYTCVRFDLPGYDLSQPPRPVSVKEMTALVRKIADTVSPNEKVTMLVHDWGCFFGYEFTVRHLDKVARVVGVDIGDVSSGAFRRSLSVSQKFGLVGYQVWLALAWQVGKWLPSLANWMTLATARWARCRNQPDSLSWQMNYPYSMSWFGTKGGMKGAARADKVLGIKLPLLYLYGERKPFMFHSSQWLESLRSTQGNDAVGFATGHWVMHQQTEAFNATVRRWLDQNTPLGHTSPA